MKKRDRESTGLVLFALLPLSGCLCPRLDIETHEVAEFRFEPTGAEETELTSIEQVGGTVAGLLELVKVDEEVRYTKRNRRIPTVYTSQGVHFGTEELTCVYWLLARPKPVAWKEVEGQFRRGEKTGITRQRSSPFSAASVEWELALADGPVAGLVETDTDGRFTISFGQSWGAIRSSLDRMIAADLRLESVYGGAVVSVPIDLLRVDEAIMRSGQ